ncbi:hypothetical protein MOK15_05625 [Sphingobium sp. BYY-5]|uniref:hypothetical protein n=1 Tax=Sphingobium sp. BYY-5 TaxID=2926400 RepID=UPI001FA80EAA|nr:hypothetical protein [Sphingobium sp. BYY-5]MCI4589569.1 hypothetical protein [Sphingobium sp. BYY-5]
MQIVMFSFLLLLVMSCAYALIAGGRDARIACAMLVSASLLTPMVTLFSHARWPLFLVDSSLLVGLTMLAMRSRYFWPMWVAGMHGVTVAGHIASTLTPNLPWNVYHAIIAFWSIPVQLTMALGIFLDSRGTNHADAHN